MEHIGELISGRLLAIGPMASIGEAAAMLDREHVSHLLVMKDAQLVGVLCCCDVEGAAQTDAVGQAMTCGPVTIDAGATPSQALASMHAYHVSCLPVVDHGAVCGVVTLHDLVRLGFADEAERCSACGSADHVRCEQHGALPGLCLECARRSQPPAEDDELGGAG